MPRISPTTTDAFRAAGSIGGIGLIVAGTYDSRWIPVIGCLAVAALATTEYALARVRRWIRDTEERTERQLALAAQSAPLTGPSWWPAETGLTADGLLHLLEAVHRELLQANEAAARAQAELADLTREWNSLVQESMRRQPDV